MHCARMRDRGVVQTSPPGHDERYRAGGQRADRTSACAMATPPSRRCRYLRPRHCARSTLSRQHSDAPKRARCLQTTSASQRLPMCYTPSVVNILCVPASQASASQRHTRARGPHHQHVEATPSGATTRLDWLHVVCIGVSHAVRCLLHSGALARTRSVPGAGPKRAACTSRLKLGSSSRGRGLERGATVYACSMST